MKIKTTKLKPFLRWAGGKRWLIKHIDQYLPTEFNNYHEPFLGGGAIFVYLKSNNLINGISYLSDYNQDLINSYIQVQQNVDAVLEYLKNLDNTKENYYNVRANIPINDIEKAARFIFLNKTSYNGIYRVNKKGEYNVPYGNRKGNDLFEIENIKNISNLFNQDVYINSYDFSSIMNNIEENDLVFLDPPYTVAHENNGFIEYNQKIFQWADQQRLATFIEELNHNNVNYILTNAAHYSITELFGGLGNQYTVQRYNTIGGKGASRKQINEYIFSNIRI